MKGRFPDPNIVRAMLVPFRRVWQQREPCQYLKVANILKKYVPELRGFIDSVLLDREGPPVTRPPWCKDMNLSLTDVVDLWLNTRYLHVGKTARQGRFTRQDFERDRSQIGPVPFEFYFLSAVHEAGICFFNILQCAQSFLRDSAQHDLVPSFAFEPDAAQEYVERTTPDFTPEEDSPRQRVWRLRRRRHYDGLNGFLDLVACPDERAAQLISQCQCFDEFVIEFNVDLEHAAHFNDLNQDDFTHFRPCIDNYPATVKNRRSRRGFVWKRRNGTLVWGEDYVPVLRDQYIEFRQALMQEPFV